MPDRSAARPETGAPRLHVEVEGTGPVLVLGHGFGGSARNFRAQSRTLGDAWRVVRFDARGHARSAAPDDPAAYTPEALVADLGRVLDAAGAARAVVGGLSMGARIALRFALAHPERTRALVLAAFPSGAGVPGSVSTVAHEFADAVEREGLEAAGARYVWGAADDVDARAANLLRRGFLEHEPHAIAYLLRGVLAAQQPVEALVPALAQVRVPVLVVVGADDRLSRAASETLVRALPDARLVVVPHAGHLVNLAQPAAFNAALRTFLDALPPE